ncbi:hypothetical protein ACK8P5_23315 [Paenibacillus sp. EC2-1]|uniref:hypothetical protein n=1 Tax=Paenibacillus sp. EC2-1 TaxID=3388665 RepID=UPI003BEF4081
MMNAQKGNVCAYALKGKLSRMDAGWRSEAAAFKVVFPIQVINQRNMTLTAGGTSHPSSSVLRLRTFQSV